MAEPSYASFPIGTRRTWVRLRTLVLLRWFAVIGQTVTLLIATLALGIQVPQLPCALVVLSSAVFNAVGMGVAARTRQLREREALYTLLFDLFQLGALLYLTGGLGNPFALLLMVPVTISASVLSLRATLLLGAVAGVIITLLVSFYVPLELVSGEHLALSPVVAGGTWTALITGMIFLAIGARRVTGETLLMSEALAATQLALAREQQLSTLGGVVAAAAHELGTPLATIKLASTELVEELGHMPHLQEDAALVRAQAIRCTEILRAMGPRGKQDIMVRSAPLLSVVEEAAAPHTGRGIRVITRVEGGLADDPPDDQPQMQRRPEIVQGLRNLVQNAVDFAGSTVWIDLEWTDRDIRVVIGDDGPGYPPDLIGRIGDPFVRRRSRLAAERPAYEGMGLGLFIAKTLLERSGARLDFRNADPVPEDEAAPPEFSRPTGAVVTVVWPRAAPETGLSLH
jgi:two-component system sensor histidine kinase RegB